MLPVRICGSFKHIIMACNQNCQHNFVLTFVFLFSFHLLFRPVFWGLVRVCDEPFPIVPKQHHQRRAKGTHYQHFPGFCAGCILPINNGKERNEEALVIDFESTHFVGTLLIRIKQAPDNDRLESNQNDPTTVGVDYFEGKKRKFQAVITGRFKTALSMSHCVTGQTFDRPAGRLPARWIVTAFIKFISTLAPQLEATLDGKRPRFLTPLVATAHTVLVKEKQVSTNGGTLRQQSQNIEVSIEEPPSVAGTSILAALPDGLGVGSVLDTTNVSVTSRMKARKKVFNALAAKKSLEPRFVTNQDTEYTFEFYQHLLDFGEEMAVDLGRVGGKVGLAQATDGQPLKILAAYRHPETNELDTLWSFDVWHESLYPYAEMALRD
jgi:hypothetical protein